MPKIFRGMKPRAARRRFTTKRSVYVFKPLVIPCLIAMLACNLTVGPAPASAAQTARVVVNGKVLAAGATQVIGGRAYIALRPLAQLLGADVSADTRSNTVTVTTLLRQAIFRIDDAVATFNGTSVRLDAPARKVGGRVFIPLRSLSQAFGATVTYRQQDHSIVVQTDADTMPQNGTTTSRPVAAVKTIDGTVTAVEGEGSAPAVQLDINGSSYNINVPSGTRIEFRDIHGALTAKGYLKQVRPGDVLIVSLDGNGQLIAIADIFASAIGTIASVAGSAMVLTNGKVISAEPKGVTVILDGRPADFSALKAGDTVSIRSDPKTGRVRDVVALTPLGATTSGPAPAATAQSANGAVQIKSVRENAEGAFRAGQTLRISADGTSGAQAFFDLSNLIVDNGMRETYPGHYEGDFLVGVGTNLTDAPIIVRFNKNGDTAVAEAPDPINILTTPPSVRDTAPATGQQINSARPNIYAAFSTVGDKGMDTNSLRMVVNGRDVTATATRTFSFISYYPPAELGPGTVQVEVRGTDIAGNALQYRWAFIVLGR
ncbi:MAG: copper amine oxidase N-terminal domain-containing protein [Candidatus Eremiobacteraeota bacterium]|nr:copper amine oxidase N-terminal domain-containing protein [Candidatus Eremiobacteraeota bacterium]